MKKIFLLLAFAAMAFVACEKPSVDPVDPKTPETPEGPDTPEVEEMLPCFWAKAVNGETIVNILQVNTNNVLSAVLDYSTDGKEWLPYTFDHGLKLEKAGDYVYFRAGGEKGYNENFSVGDQDLYYFTTSDWVELGGNLMSLLDASMERKSVPDYAFFSMFTQTKIKTAPELPATELGKYCYCDMFNKCTGLTAGPDLPAETLADSCYKQMFMDCSALASLKVYATNIAFSACLRKWLEGAGTDVTNPVIYVRSWKVAEFAASTPSSWLIDVLE